MHQELVGSPSICLQQCAHSSQFYHSINAYTQLNPASTDQLQCTLQDKTVRGSETYPWVSATPDINR
jgi:hypothetical protein